MGITKKAALLTAAVMMLSGCGKTEDTTTVYNSMKTTAETKEPQELEKYIITCAEVAYRTISEYENELPNTMEVTDETMISDVLQYDMSIAEDYSVYMQLISTDLFEFTVIRAAKENIDAVKLMLDKRLNYLREQAAYYPSQVAAADAALTGEINGYCYLICCENAADLQKRLMFYVLRN